MRVFVTGASGWIGSAVIPEVIAAGHEVVGLARSDASAAAVEALGAQVRRGSLTDLESLRAGAEESDGVIHLAFNHDFSDMAGAGRSERAALETYGEVLAGTGRPLLMASGVAQKPGQVLTEQDASPYATPDSPRGGGEALALSFADRGVRPVAVRFAPTVHGPGDHGFVAELVRVAREEGAVGYVGDGSNRWPAVNRLDAAALVARALDRAAAGSIVHAIAQEGVATRAIAEAIAGQLDLPTVSVQPDDVSEHFGWIGMFFGMDLVASSAITQRELDWTPSHAGLIEDIEQGAYTLS